MDAPRRPSLAGDAEIDRLVRHFAAVVLFKRAAFQRGDPGAGNPVQDIEHDARELSAALALTPYGRAMFTYLLPDETRHVRDPGAALGLWIASQTVQMAAAIENAEPEAKVKPKIEAMLADVVARLTGEKY
ncbi:hypothetical protein [Paraburkholderia strydomiana]|uniref:hypothetical protein n=1 Tax=Paraburkholderia strydomiana TaxID=1245417 RepID=UPI0038B796FD